MDKFTNPQYTGTAVVPTTTGGTVFTSPGELQGELFKLPDWNPPQVDMLTNIKAAKLDPRAILPKQGKVGDAGYDLYALEDVVIPGLLSTMYMTTQLTIANYISAFLPAGTTSAFPQENITLPSLSATKIRTGIALQLPVGHVGLIMDRSGMGSKLLKVFGGVCDCNYRGEIMVCLANFTFFDYQVKAGDRVAQLVIQEYKSYPVIEQESLEESVRGDGGFGSSGR